MEVSNNSTILEAKRFLRKFFKKGVECPCCGQKVKAYRRSLCTPAVADFLRLCREYMKEKQPIHHAEFTQQRSNFYTLNYWGLIEPGVYEGGEQKSAGTWMPTERGMDFAMGNLKLHKSVMTYDNTPYEFEGELINVHEALGNKFKYSELFY